MKGRDGNEGTHPGGQTSPAGGGKSRKLHVTQSLQVVGIQRLEHALRSLRDALCIVAAAMAAAHAGESALHTAVEKGDRKQVERLLQGGADANARTESGETALHYAAFPKDAWFAAALIKAGADPRATNSAGESPLFWAALEANVAVAHVAARARRSECSRCEG